MKHLFIFFSIQLIFQSVWAQDPAYPSAPLPVGNIIKAEYFFDIDPGFGSGVNIPFATGTDLPNVLTNINTASLSNGTHRMYMRTLNAEGKWSSSNIQEFIVDFNPSYPALIPAPGNIIKAEYFFDTDPGFGNATTIAVSAASDLSNVLATVNTASLDIGTHRLYLRTLNVENKWSITNVKEFLADFNPAYPTVPAATGNIVKAEYFFDTDPGFGNAINIAVTAASDISNVLANANTSALSIGTHRIYLRTLNIEGKWSITNANEFLVDLNPAYPPSPAVVDNIIKAEYFFDTDPGFGNGINIPVTAVTNISNLNVNANTTGLTNGTHRIYLRTLNMEGKWSISNVNEFVYDADPAYPVSPAAPGNITVGEYFYDTDPGFGNGFEITVSPSVDLANVNFVANTSGLTDGNHKMFIRTKENWSITNFTSFLKGAPVPLRLLSFNGNRQAYTIRLNWITENELNSSHFEVERSNNAATFTFKGVVSANNSVLRNYYSFTDQQALAGISYYRLKQFDLDGQIVYSPVIKILPDKNEFRVLVLPNPAKDKINIIYPVMHEKVNIEIFNAEGKQFIQILQTDMQPLQVDVGQLPAGVYFLRLTDGMATQKVSFVKE